MRIRTLVTALVVATPLLALESPQAAACWGTGYGYTATATPVAPVRRYGYMSYGYSSPAYYGGYGGYYGGLAMALAAWPCAGPSTVVATMVASAVLVTVVALE